MNKKTIGMGIALGAIALSEPAFGAKTIFTPYTEKGAIKAEMKSAYAFNDEEEGDEAWDIEASAAYGLTDFWEAEIGFAIEDEGIGEDAELAALIFENTLQLTKPGEFFVDAGLKIEYEHSLTGAADSIAAKLMLAKEFGKIGNVLNIGIGHEFGDDAEDDAVYDLAYGISYEPSDDFAIGAEWYSDFGNFEGDFDEQSHQIGPVAYGELPFGVEYDAGILFAVSESAPDAELKLNIGYEF